MHPPIDFLEISATAQSALMVCLYVAMATAASVHAIMRKDDVRSAVGWVAMVWLAPVVGSLAYVAFGINRVRRRATAMRRAWATAARRPRMPSLEEATRAMDCIPTDQQRLATMNRRIAGVPLTRGNSCEPLIDGDEAYPAMLAAIDTAQRSIALATYIFDNDSIGRRFASAMRNAVRRGVEVRVLIDAVGALYSRPPMARTLRQYGIRTALFNPLRIPFHLPYLNLRNHRKILVVDGTTGFTGGMNIRQACLSQGDRPPTTRDLHFRLRGPVVTQLMHFFAEDWSFCTREELRSAVWFPTLVSRTPRGSVVASCIPDGPDEDFDTLRWILLAALSQAERQVWIVTPYFLPDSALLTALRLAALRGVRVVILLPINGNSQLVRWASQVDLEALVRSGCEVYWTNGSFDHSKGMVVDSSWALFGSMNWDDRSLRLNFELNVEAYDVELAQVLEKHWETVRQSASCVTLEMLSSASFWQRLRNRSARLLSPYL